jgi:hypothetical protein
VMLDALISAGLAAGSYRLTLPGGDADAWASRHGIASFESECACGRMRRTTVPFAAPGCRGLVAPECPCGEPPPYAVVGWSR